MLLCVVLKENEKRLSIKCCKTDFVIHPPLNSSDSLNHINGAQSLSDKSFQMSRESCKLLSDTVNLCKGFIILT